ncbi:MAG: choice-of-anchor L domain-containing protein [Enhygromyxa sp.]
MVRFGLKPVVFTLPLSLATLALGCADEDIGATTFTSGAGTEAGDGDGDGDGNEGAEAEAGDGDGDPTGDGDSTGDGDGDSTGDGDGDSTGDGDGDGDGDSTGDGDGDDDPPCQSDADCVDNDAPICDGNGECVPCTPDNDVCAIGQYCTNDNVCVVGCLDDQDCPNDLVCGDNNTCTGCVMDAHCPLGSICDAGDCVPGCTDQQPCQDGFSCCGGDCKDLTNDPEYCGSCDNSCPDFPNAEDMCVGGMCTPGACEGLWNDCDGDPNNGCETQAQCACVPGEEISCYTGFPANTEGVGVCKAGTRTCNAMGTGYGACVGQVIPGSEICNNNLDDNCNGEIDENPDLDNDGWGVCDGDCCDQVSPDCATPGLVNPGAFEVAGNGVDDDCDGQIDNPLPLCDAGLAADSATPDDYAKAIDLCQFTEEDPPLAEKKWGVINSWLRLANDDGDPSEWSRSIRPEYGDVIMPQNGQHLAVFSSGSASYPGAPFPTFWAFQPGVTTGTTSPAPADWLAANGGSFPNAPGCPSAGSTTAYNPIMYKVRIRVPTNANSFSVKMYFFSAEYPEWVCTPYNDFFVTLVNSTSPNNPADRNIAIYSQGNDTWPVGVNLVKAANGLFSQCTNGNITQCGNQSNYNGCVNNNELTGTGFDLNATACGYNGPAGGATGWLTMSGNVTPGEVMEIRFVIWDTGDAGYDSLVLLDDWQWSVQASEPGVSPG